MDTHGLNRILDRVTQRSHGAVLDVLGPTVELLSTPSPRGDFSVIRGVLPPGGSFRSTATTTQRPSSSYPDKSRRWFRATADSSGTTLAPAITSSSKAALPTLGATTPISPSSI
jgi:hypothetical protein